MNRQRIHWTKSPLCGKSVRLKPDARHHLHKEFGGRYIRIINWWDRTFRYSPYAIEWSVYGARKALCNLSHTPLDDILLGLIDGRREIVHVSELEPLETNPEPTLPEAA